MTVNEQFRTQFHMPIVQSWTSLCFVHNNNPFRLKAFKLRPPRGKESYNVEEIHPCG